MKLVLPKSKVIKPVRASAAVESWYFAQLKRLTEGMAKSLELHIAAAWRANEPEYGLAHDASPVVGLKRAVSKWGKRWIAKFDAMAPEMARRFSEKSQAHTARQMRARFGSAGLTVKFTPTKEAVEAYRAVLTQNVALIKSIPREYVTGIENAVWESAMKGRDVGGLQEALRTRYGIGLRRSALIARDQNRKATSVMQNVQYKNLGITHAVWVHSHAVKEPRPSHLAFSGHIYEISKGAHLDGKWVWPGTEINCRCNSAPIIPGVNDADIEKLKARLQREQR